MLYRLFVAGDGDPAYVRRLHELTERRGLTDRVCFTGFVSGAAKRHLLERTDLFVLPSYAENFGVAVAEAMAASLPVIVSEHVGLAGAVATVNAGVVVPAKVEQLAVALSGLLANPEKRRSMGAAGRASAEAELAWPKIARELLGLYAEIARLSGSEAVLDPRQKHRLRTSHVASHRER